jgi:hypothetical protein
MRTFAALLLSLFPFLSAAAGITLLSRRQSLQVIPKAGFYFAVAGLVLWSLPDLFKLDPLAFAGSIMQAALVLISLSALFELGARLSSSPDLGSVNSGLALACGVMAAISLFQVLGLVDPWLPTVPRAHGWLDHPNTWAALGLLPGLALLIVPSGVRARAAGLTALVIHVLFTGSRMSFATILAFALTVSLIHIWTHVDRRLYVPIMAALLLVSAFLVAAHPRIRADIWEIGSASVQAAGGREGDGNLLALSGGQSRHVTVDDSGDGGTLKIKKIDENWWARYQRQVLLFPGTTYALGLNIKRITPHALSGILGSGRQQDVGTNVELRAWLEDDDLKVESTPELRLRTAKAERIDGDWLRLELLFTYTGSSHVRWWVGPTPDQRPIDSGAVIAVKNMQINRGSELLPYSAEPPYELPTMQALSRIAAFKVAWQGFLERPILGQESGSFERFFRRHPPTPNPAVITHAHNLFLHTLFERGLAGTFGLALFLIGIAVIGKTGSKRFVFLMAAILLANLFDMTFWAAGTAYGLAALAGFIGGTKAELNRAEQLSLRS